MVIPTAEVQTVETDSPIFYDSDVEDDSVETFIVSTWMSVAGAVEKIEHVDDLKFITTLKYPKEIRDRITEVRNWCKRNIDWFVLSFHTLKLATKSGKQSIEKIVADADAKLKAINPYLNSDCYFIPLDVSAIKDSKIKNDLVANMMLEYTKDVVNIIAKRKQLTDRAKVKIGQLKRKYSSLNIFKDEDLSTFIEAIASQLITGDLTQSKSWLAEKIEGIDLDVSDSVKEIFESAKTKAVADAVSEVL